MSTPYVEDIAEKLGAGSYLSAQEQLDWRDWHREIGGKVAGLFAGAPNGGSITEIAQITSNLGKMYAGEFTALSPLSLSLTPTDLTFIGSFFSGTPYSFGGSNYHVGGVNHGVLQWGANSDNGKLSAASGNLSIGSAGIVLNQAHILAQLSANSNYPVTYVDDVYYGGFHVLGTSTAANGQIRFGHLAVMRYGSNVFSNGDFASGDFTSWTTAGSPTIVQDSPDGTTYAARVDNSNYVTQNVTTVSGDDYILTFYIRHVSGADVGVLQIGANSFNLLGADQTATNSWIKVVVLFRATASSMAIKAFSQLATGAIWYFTGFDCRRLDTWSYVGDYDSDHLGNLELQSLRNITIEAKNANAWPPLVVLKNALTQLQQLTPATPGATYDTLYFKADDKLYKKISAGTETAFAEGTGTASGTNNGDVTIGTANGLSLAGQVLSLTPMLSPDANVLANGGFQLFRRQAHTAPATLTSYSNDTYCFDRWYALTQTASIQFAQTSGDNNRYACQMKQNQASAQRFGMAQILSAGKSIGLRGQNVIFQIRAKSSATPALRVAILEWTGTADAVTSDVVNSWANGTFTAGQFFKSTTMTVTAVSATANASGSFADFSVTGTVSASCNNLIVMVWSENTAAQNVTIDVAKSGLFTASVLQTWQEKELIRELQDCSFYFRTWADASQTARLPFGSAISTTQAIVGFTFPMRTQPTISFTGTIQLFSTTTGGATAVSSASISNTDETYQSFNAVFTVAAGLTAGASYFPLCNAAGSYVWLDAEL